MATKQGYLKEKGSQDKLAPKTLDSLVKDSARNRALSASLQELAERQCLGYPPFATTQNYTVGDKVFYDRKLWKFTSTHAAGAWNASHVTAWSVEDEVSELKLAVTELDERKANIDGFYEGMGVGVAKRLEGNTDVAGSFLERTTGGDAELANGLAQLNEVQGGSVKFNQWVKNGNFADGKTNWSSQRGTISAQNNILTAISTDESGTCSVYQHYGNFVVGHKYYATATILTTGTFTFGVGGSGTALFTGIGAFKKYSIIKESTIASNTVYWFFANGTTSQVMNVSSVDLTAIFGEGNEPTTAEEFEAWLAENVGLQEYYDYTNGEVINNNMTGIESTGFNLFNPTTGKARIIGAYSEVYGNYYGITGTHGTLTFEDDLGNVSTITPDSDGKFELDVSGYLSVADAGNDVAVFLWWDGKKTEYEDYDVEIAHLDVRHIYGKKNGTGELVQVWPTGMPRINDVVDKLCIENGAVVAKRAIQEVDLGTLTYIKDNSGYFQSVFNNDAKHYGANTVADILNAKYVEDSCTNVASNDKTIGIYYEGGSYNKNYLRIKDSSYSDAATFKTAMSGVLLYYELATPETYTDLVYIGSEYFADGTPVALPVNYKVDNWGVESILPKNTSTILTAKPTIKVRYAIDAVEQLNTHSDQIEDLYDGLDELDEAKANTVGVYDDMVVGAAKAIAGNHRLDKEFTSMVVEGADGVAKINEVRGKSLVWNQLVQNGNFANGITGWTHNNTTISASDNVLSMLASQKYGSINEQMVLVSGHKYYLTIEFKPTTPNANVYVGVGDSRYFTSEGVVINTYNITDINNFTKRSIIGTYTKNVNTVESLILLMDLRETNIDTVYCKNVQVIDLTQMFGSGNEPATVEEFEALFPDAYYEYNDGKIINNATEELDIYDSEETLKSTLPLNLSTITGKQVGVEDAESVVIFPNGMRQAGNVADTLIVDDDGYARRALVRFGSVDLGTLDWGKSSQEEYSCAARSDSYPSLGITDDAWAISSKYTLLLVNGLPSTRWINNLYPNVFDCGDNRVFINDPSIENMTNQEVKSYLSGVKVYYQLATPLEYILDEPILMTFRAYHGGTIVQSPQAPDSAPMSMNVTFALDAVGTLNNLPKNYISADSMDAFLAQLGTAMNGTWTKSWDAANSKYTFSFQSSQTE